MFINIADPKVLAIPIQESHEVLIDLKDQTILQFGPPPECEATKNCYTKLRKTVVTDPRTPPTAIYSPAR